MSPIILWNTRRTTSIVSDEAGTIIQKTILPPVPHLGPYESKSNTISQTFHFIPSLTYFALKILSEYPDELDLCSNRLYYQPPSSPLAYDVLRALIPSYDSRPESESGFSLTAVDPRLWAVLVQVYNNLPEAFRTYSIPLSDRHLPVLQRIRSTSEFSLITVLNLEGCEHLTDETTVTLKDLHGLCAFDASGTALSAYGVRVLSRTLQRTGGGMKERRGPWGLRILRLRNCKSVDNSIYTCLSAFPLLSVVDLRETKCIPNGSIPDIFRPGSDKNLYHPTLLTTSLRILTSSTTKLFSSPGPPFILHIASLHHEGSNQIRSRLSVAMQDTYVVIPSIKKESDIASTCHVATRRQRAANIMVGNSEALARRSQRMEELERHERNKEAWYERNANAIWDQTRGMGMSGYQSSEMDDRHDRLGWDTDATDNEGDETGMDDSSEGQDECENEGVDGTNDNDDSSDGENYDDEVDCPGDENEEVPSTGDVAHGHFLGNPLPNAPPPSSPPSRTQPAPETETASAMSTMNIAVVSSGFDFGNVAPGLPTLTLTTDNVQDFRLQTKQSAAHSPCMVQSPTLTSTLLAPLSKPLDHMSRTGPADTSTTHSLPRTFGPATSRKQAGDGQLHYSDLDQMDRPSEPMHTGSGRLGVGMSAPVYGACDYTIGTESQKTIGSSFADSDVCLPSTSHKRRRKTEELPAYEPVASGHGSLFPRRIREPGIASDTLAILPRDSRIANRNPSGRVRAAPSSIKSTSGPHRPPRVSNIVSGPSPVMQPRPPSVTPSTPSQIDFQNLIAAAEARGPASRQAAIQFYHRSSTFPRRPPRPQMQESLDHDEFLMLYRNPPPWSHLDAQPNTAKTEGKRPATELAILNRARAMDGVKALAEMIKRRKDVGDALPLAGARGGTVNTSKSESRNPFRRKEEPMASQSAMESGTRKEVLMKPAPEKKFCDNHVGKSLTSKALMPISFLQPPALPEEFREQRTKTSQSRKPMAIKGASSPVDSSQQARPGQVSSGSSSIVKKTKGDKKAFDWKTWSKMGAVS